MSTTFGVFIREELENVKKERDFLMTLFTEFRMDLIPMSDPGIEQLLTSLNSAKDRITSFHFSGHSNNESLHLFQSDLVDGKGLMPFLNTFPNLKFVFINGCCNEELIEQLDSIPIVIGTKTNINDRKAADFAEHFYSSLVKNNRDFKTSFRDGMNLTNAIQENEQLSTSVYQRVRGFSDINDQNLPEIGLNKWVMYHVPHDPSFLDLDLKQIVVQTDFEEKIKRRFKDFLGEAYIKKIPVYCYFPALFAESFKKFFITIRGQIDDDCSKIGFARFNGIKRIFSQAMLFFKSIVLALVRNHFSAVSELDLTILLDRSIDFSDGDTSFSQITDKWLDALFKICDHLASKIDDEREIQLVNDILKIDKRIVLKLAELYNKAVPGPTEFYEAEELFENFIAQIFFVSRYNIESVRKIKYYNYPHYMNPIFRVEKITYNLDPDKIHDYKVGKLVNPEMRDPGYHHLSSVFLKEKDGEFSLNLTPFIIDLNSLAVKSNNRNADFYFMNFYRPEIERVAFIKSSSISNPIDTDILDNTVTIRDVDDQNDMDDNSKEVIKSMMKKYLDEIQKNVKD